MTAPPGASGATDRGAAASGKKTNEAIATGGTKSTTVNISIGNLVKDFKITAANLEDSTTKIRDVIVGHLARVVSMGAALGS